MSARRLSVATLVVLCTLVGSIGFGSGSALAALKTAYLRQLPTSFNHEAFDLEGNVYVPAGSTVDKFNSVDTPLEFSGAGLYPYVSGSSLTGTPEGPFGEVTSVAVAANGNIYVVDSGTKMVDIFEASGKFLTTWNGSNTPRGSFRSQHENPEGYYTGLREIAVNRITGQVYISEEYTKGKTTATQELLLVNVFGASGEYLSQVSIPGGEFETKYHLAVDEATGELFISAAQFGRAPSVVYEFSSMGVFLVSSVGLNSPAKAFGNGGVPIAVDESTGELLVADGKHGVVDTFDSNFNYLAPQAMEGLEPKELEEGATIGVNGATGEIYVQTPSAVEVFGSVVLPDVVVSAPANLHATSATLGGLVNPVGVQVEECKFEYGPEASEPEYAQSVPCEQSRGAIGKGNGLQSVSVAVSGLQPDTLYHFRLDAKNANGLNLGMDTTFFTSTAPIIEAESSSDVGSVGATVGAQINSAGLASTYHVEYGATTAYGSSTPEVSAGATESLVGVLEQLSDLKPATEYHYRVVATNADGTTRGVDVTFTTLPSPGVSGSTLPDGRIYELVSRPNAEDKQVYTPSGDFNLAAGELSSAAPMEASSDGSVVAYVADPAPSGSGSSGTGFGNEFVASRGPGGWTDKPIVPAGSHLGDGTYKGFSGDLSVGILGSFEEPRLTSEPEIPGFCEVLYTRTVGEGAYRALFTKLESPTETCGERTEAAQFVAASTDGSHIAFAMASALIAGAPGGKEENLYESVEGRLNPVNVLPDGVPVGNAKFGGASDLLYDRVLSSDGSRLFWTDLNNHDLYVHENGGTPQQKTVLVAEGAEYQTSSADGSRVFFTKGGDLYSFDVNSGKTTGLTSAGEVQGVAGASEDGSYVYFVGNGALAGSAIAGQPNLYLSRENGGRWETPEYVATLGTGDAQDWASTELWNNQYFVNDVSYTAETTSDGHSLVFMSSQNLTSYNSYGTGEVYVYDADSAQLTCASCETNGMSPQAGGGFLSHPMGEQRLPRWISEDGSRVFFDTAEPLIPQDVNDQTDVYEWERNGSGGCSNDNGCIYLLSSGEGTLPSWFVDASATGNDVFFTSSAQLIPEDQNDNVDLYDVRVSPPPVSPPLCSGSGCQGVPPAPPIFATPSSVTYAGVGNFEGSATTPVKPRGKVAKCKRGSTKKHDRCVKVKTRKASKRSKRRKQK